VGDKDWSLAGRDSLLLSMLAVDVVAIAGGGREVNWEYWGGSFWAGRGRDIEGGDGGRYGAGGSMWMSGEMRTGVGLDGEIVRGRWTGVGRDGGSRCLC
jgi:hypothetical protein